MAPAEANPDLAQPSRVVERESTNAHNLRSPNGWDGGRAPFFAQVPRAPVASVRRAGKVAFPASAVRRRDARHKTNMRQGEMPCSRYSIDAPL
jgi:hypothetical protein